MSKNFFSTKALHAGYEPSQNVGTRAVPIYQSTAYVLTTLPHAANLFLT